jgi:signal transduction histidine kinase
VSVVNTECGRTINRVNANADDLAAITHEMRTPLTAILGVMEFLSETDLDERQMRWVALAQDASDRLLGLVNGVLDDARRDTRKRRIRASEVAIDAVVRASISLIEPIAILRPVTLRLVNEPAVDLCVRGDEDCLGQVLVNLLSNAIKFSPPAGTVTVAVRELDAHVRIDVQDQGSGIAPACADRLFRPFERLDAEARGVTGTGLGLSLSRDCVQEMGGTLEVVDSADTGARFRVQLPLLRSSVCASILH